MGGNLAFIRRRAGKGEFESSREWLIFLISMCTVFADDIFFETSQFFMYSVLMKTTVLALQQEFKNNSFYFPLSCGTLLNSVIYEQCKKFDVP